jgi:cytochrome P450
MTDDDDLLAPANVRDPYPLLARLRQEDPVHWSERLGAWMILRYDDLFDALRDERLSSNRVQPVFETKLTPAEQLERGPTFEVLRHWMVFNDPPRHSRLRQLVSAAFTPRAIELLRPRVEKVVDGLLDDLEGHDEIDLIGDFAYPIPATIIAEMMGVPEEDRPRFKDWSDCIMALVFGAKGERDRRARAQRGLLDLCGYLHSLVARFRARPEENLITSLIEARDADDSLTDEEIVATCTLLLFGGHETTTNLIGNGTRTLLEHPDQLARFRAEPALLQSAVEELLRFDGPSKLEVRRVAQDMDFGGRAFREGQQVLLLQASANRDPDVFPAPDTLDLERHPNRHIGFGFGIHYCLGASVARLEGSVGLRKLFDRFPDLAPADEPPTWHPLLVSRGMSRFAVRPGPSRRPMARHPGADHLATFTR